MHDENTETWVGCYQGVCKCLKCSCLLIHFYFIDWYIIAFHFNEQLPPFLGTKRVEYEIWAAVVFVWYEPGIQVCSCRSEFSLFKEETEQVKINLLIPNIRDPSHTSGVNMQRWLKTSMFLQQSPTKWHQWDAGLGLPGPHKRPWPLRHWEVRRSLLPRWQSGRNWRISGAAAKHTVSLLVFMTLTALSAVREHFISIYGCTVQVDRSPNAQTQKRSAQT